MNTEEINKSFVLSLVEGADKKLSIVEQKIDKHELLELYIDEMSENPNRTLWDFWSRVEKYCDGPNGFYYCYPYTYNNSYWDGLSRPELSKEEYEELEKELKKEITKSYGYKNKSPKKKAEYLEKELNERMIEEKKEKAKDIKNYIRCRELNKTISSLKEDESVKMYSTENIGWSTFSYPINENIHIKIMTNFAYGSSSYFLLTVKYKDIVVVPYSFLVNYYYANTLELISCTRSYKVQRECWYDALKFVEEFTNNCIKSPEVYIKQYIIKEIEKMMSGLRLIIKNPEEVSQRISDSKSDYISWKVISPLDRNNKEISEMLPNEFHSVFKSEKISGALDFIESLNQMKELYNEITPYIEEIKKMNSSIKGEIKATIDSINKDIDTLSKEKETINKKQEIVNKKIEEHEKQISLLTEGKGWEESENIEEKYKEEHPEYLKQQKQSKELNDKSYELYTHISYRNEIKERMENCMTKILENNI